MVCLARDIKEMKEIIKEDFRNEMKNIDEDFKICNVKLAKGWSTNEYFGTVLIGQYRSSHDESFHMHIEAWDGEDFVWRLNGYSYMPK